ncbi:MAG: phage minor structural protein [Clostridiaceae bacterium]|jgi:phage-related protein|nr:phage minor structural protein [Clostridiaceae bacterium]
MVSLFFSNTTDFDNNGIVLIDCLMGSVKITEDLEGVFDLELEYPIQDRKNISKYLVHGNIIRSPVHDSRPDQLFRIRKASIDSSNSKISVYAQAIGRCDLMNDFVFGGGDFPLVPKGKTRKEAIALVLAAAQDNSNKFHVGNLDTSTNTNVNLGLDDNGNIIDYIDVAYMSPLTGLISSTEGTKSIYNAYGGEIIYNNFTIDMVDERGNDNEFTIRSGKNLQEFQQDVDDMSDDFATVLVMKSSDGIYLPNNEVIISSNAEIIGKVWKVITCDDVSAVDDTPEALEVVYEQLRERGKNKFAKDGMDSLTISNTVKFVQLRKTEQYKDYNILEKCELGNNVTIIYSKLNNLTVNARITKVVYNPLALNGQGKILEVTIGNRKGANIVNIIDSAAKVANTANTKGNANKTEIKKVKKDSKQFQVNMEARADSIELSVTNLKTDTESKIEVLDGQIRSKVSKGDFGSLIEQNYDSVREAVKSATGTHEMILDNSGTTIKNGGFTILDGDGDLAFKCTEDGYVAIKDMILDDAALKKGSNFYHALMNMKEVKLNGDLITGDLYVGGTIITEFIENILKQYHLI